MTPTSRLTRTILAAALGLAAVPAFAQDATYTHFDQTVFFGDSLTDSGFYQPFLVEQFGPSAASVARFTTNPGLVWAEFLADYYGTNATPAWQLSTTGIAAAGGDNFAAGGATVSPGPGYPPTIPTQFAPSLTDQVGAYLAANGGAANPDALYTVWGGANDLFFYLGGATTQVQFLGAAAAEVGLVGTLESAGARYVLVPTMPDIGLTPFGLSQGAAGSAGLTQLAVGYNATLFGGLQAAGLRVIPLDVFHFLRELSSDPTTYGLTNVTTPACGAAPSLGCNPANFVDPTAAQTYAFADGVHPTTASHALLAQYAESILEAPNQIAVLPHSASVVGRARADRVSAHMAGTPSADGMRWWADLRGDFQRYGDGNRNRYDGAGPTLTAGVDWASGRLVYGGFVGYGRQSQDWGHRMGSFSQTDASVGGFLGWTGDSAWVNGQVSYSRLGFDTDRNVRLGPATRIHHGSADGSNLSAAINAGWDFVSGDLRQGPVASVLSQHIDVDGFAESDPQLSTSLAYPEQRFNSLIGSLGWQASFRANDHLAPYARLTWDREFRRAPDEAFAQAQSMPGTLPYAVPGAGYDRNYGTLLVGARTQVLGLDANVGVTATVAQQNGNDATVFATVGSRF